MLCIVVQFLYSEAMDHNEFTKGIDTLEKKVVKDSAHSHDILVLYCNNQFFAQIVSRFCGCLELISSSM